MFEHLTRNGPYSEATAAGFMRELAAALRFLHSHEIIHADLKPENLMLSSWDLVDSKLKVCFKSMLEFVFLCVSCDGGAPAKNLLNKTPTTCKLFQILESGNWGACGGSPPTVYIHTWDGDGLDA